MRLSNKVAVVTGGGAGIGREVCLLFAEEGAKLIVVDLDEDRAQTTVSSIRDRGGQAVALRLDVSNRDEASRVGAFAVEHFGSVDVLVNNAGIRDYGPITEATEEQWDRMLAINLKAVAFVSSGVITEMAQGGGGSIVHVSSVNGAIGRGGMALYDAAKAGVISLARSMAVDHEEQGIRVNAICPGPTVTDFHKERYAAEGKTTDGLTERGGRNVGILKRHAEPREIAYGILFLACDESSYVTGSSLMVDGGIFALGTN